MTQYYTETSKVLTVPKSVFMPPPNVDSIVVKLMQREEPLVSVDDEQALNLQKLLLLKDVKRLIITIRISLKMVKI